MLPSQAESVLTAGVDTERRIRRPGAWAWGICWLMFASTVLNYMDRQAIALVGPQMKPEFALDNVGFGWVLAAFQLTYAFFQWPAGYLVDRWDVRRAYAGAVALVVARGDRHGVRADARHPDGLPGTARHGRVVQLALRLRVTAGILPPADRSLGNGIFNSGAAIGAVLTPLIVAPMAAKLGWRSPFVVVGTAGLVWVVAWLTLTRGASLAEFTPGQAKGANTGLSGPARSGFLLVVALAAATALSGLHFGLPAVWWGIAVLMVGLLVAALAMPQEWLAGADWANSLGEVVRRRRFWVIAAVGITINVTWHFLVNWMAIFFQEERRLGLLVGGMVSSLPFLAADVGNLGGGGLTRWLTRRNLSTADARKAVMTFCLILVSCGGVGRFRPLRGAGRRAPLPHSPGDGGLHGQLLRLRAGRPSPPYGARHRLPRRPGQPVRGRFHAPGREDLAERVGVRPQLRDRRTSAPGRARRAADLLGTGRSKNGITDWTRSGPSGIIRPANLVDSRFPGRPPRARERLGARSGTVPDSCPS